MLKKCFRKQSAHENWVHDQGLIDISANSPLYFCWKSIRTVNENLIFDIRVWVLKVKCYLDKDTKNGEAIWIFECFSNIGILCIAAYKVYLNRKNKNMQV